MGTIRHLLTVGALGLLASSASAAVQGLWLFDTISNPAPNPPYEILTDSSGNGRDIVKQEIYGAVSLDTNRPAVMPSGTFALNSNAGGTGSLVTDNTTAFSVANTGQLTIEFWYNKSSGNGLKYIAEYGNEGANGWDIYESAGTIHAGFRTNANAYSEMATGAIAADTWNHIALTFAADGTGRLYVNGGQVATQSYNPANFSTTNGFLRLSAGNNATYSNIALFDEFRISDVALGPDDLGWDQSFVPEPAALSLLGLGALALRRRK